MELQVLCGALFWIVLPLSLLAACIFRYNSLSLIYLLFLLLLPWFLGPTAQSMRGHTGRLMKALLAMSLLFLCAQLIFQLCLYTVPGLDDMLGYNCSNWQILAQHIGVTRLDFYDIPNTVRMLSPDFGIFLVSAVCLGLCNRLVKGQTLCEEEHESAGPVEQLEEEGIEAEHRENVDTEEEEDILVSQHDGDLALRIKEAAHKLLEAVGKTLAIILLALAGITVPSAFSAAYYLAFIGLCTWWACHFPISRLGFHALCVMIGFFAGGHIICLYVYQTQFIQNLFPPEQLWARLFGLNEIIVHYNCTGNIDDLILNQSFDWPVYVNPGILLLLYYGVISLLKMRTWRKRQEEVKSGGCVAQKSDHELMELAERHMWDKERYNLREETRPMLPNTETGAATNLQDCTVHDLQSAPARIPDEAPQSAKDQSPLHVLSNVILNQSYVCALIAMMVWSITYHSWLTFVLLLWACLIWMVRSRRQFAMLCSPFILLYGVTLCSLQYVWSMDLELELPTQLGFMRLSQLGLARAPYPCLNLGAMLLYMLTFWLLLRQFVTEKLLKHKKETPALVEVTVSGAEPSKEKNLLKCFGEQVMSFYAKYWIYLCGGMFIVVSFAGRLVVYKIVYMFIFLLCLVFFQLYYTLWRKLLNFFWWLVVAYTMLVLIAIYTFQFEDFPMYWKNLTSLTDEQLSDIGLEIFSVSELFTSILIPGFFLLACILQLHYFHKPFMQITDLARVSPQECAPYHDNGNPKVGEDLAGACSIEEGQECVEEGSTNEGPLSKWDLVTQRLTVLFYKFSELLHQVQVFLWRLLELHILKLVAVYSVWVALQEVSVMNFLFVVLWAFAMPFSRFQHMTSCLCTIWSSIIIVCKMLYQLSIVNPLEYSSNCTLPLPNGTNLLEEEILNSTLYRAPVDPANWFGIRKGYPNLGYIQNHLQILLLLVFEAIVYRHQTFYRKRYQLEVPHIQAVFPDVRREHLDEGLFNCIKYFINYFFYKFGLEICFLMTVNVIGQRMNFMVIFHGCWLIVILTRRQRVNIAKLWPKYCMFLVFFLLWQYLLCLGMPPVLCIEYPWRWDKFVPVNSALIKWMYLPDFYSPPKAINLISDFVLLLCVSQQWKVFVNEKKEEWYTMAGENVEVIQPPKDKPNPVPNFINCRSYLDMLKVVVFRYLFWFVLVVVFITGATRISVFGLGYLMSCFYLLLFGTALLQKPVKARLVLWDCLILYNITVILAKNMLSLLSCVFVQQMQTNFCWVIQLFSLVCTVKGYYNPRDMDKDRDCSLPVEEAGIIWDSICFFFLLLQRRVFLSSYFLHVMYDLRASSLQASRGFELFMASIRKNMHFHQESERRSLSQLKKQMERIRAKQEKYHQERRQSEADQEKIGEAGSQKGPSRRKIHWSRPWLDHASVLHSGDYFLFESDSEEDEELSQEEQRPPKQSAFQLAYQAWVTSAKSALKERRNLQKAEHGAQKPGGEDKVAESDTDHQGITTEIAEDEAAIGESRAGGSNVVQRILDVLRFLWVLLLAMLDGLVDWLGSLTKHYVDMSTVLWVERYILTQKLSKGEEVTRRVLDSLSETGQERKDPGSSLLLTVPTMDQAVDLQNSMASSGCEEGEVLSVTADVTDVTPSLTTGYSTTDNSLDQVSGAGCWEEAASVKGSQEIQPMKRFRTASELLVIRPLSFEELSESQHFFKSQNRLLRLLLALYHFVAAHSELLCYFIIILNNMVSASFISLFLPILVFLWAMLSVHRPSKRFWMTAIVFTEIMVVIKYLFQFGFFPWNSYTVLVRNEAKPFFPPRILGLEKSDSYVKYDLIQLLTLFFHRSLLMSYGLWDRKDMNPVEKPKSTDKESETEIEISKDPEPSGSRSSTLRRRKRLNSESSETERDSGKEKPREPDKKKKKPAAVRMKMMGAKMQSAFIGMVQGVYQPVKGFFHDILHTPYRAATDVYALMFLADVVDFVIIVFGFWAFGKYSAAADITSSLSDDQVPEAFLVMLLIQFSTMVIDRALYLRKTVLGKLIFQVILVIGIHVWMFFILPAVTERMFSQNPVAQLWYFVKCIYFALSAYQIRCGYPTRILGNFLTKKYNHVNLFLFQGFRLVPFLVELRAVMDWVWTDTTLSLSNWMCVEDIYANIFIIKCSRETEKKYPQPKGQKKKKMVKYGMGGLIIVFLICIIWFPLLFMSLVRSVVGVVNHPIDVTVTFKLGGYEPLFTMSAQQQSIQPFTQQEYETLTYRFERQPIAMQFISLYSFDDIVTARIEGSSGSVWGISPPSREQMRRELQNGSSDITLRFTWDFQRDLAKGGTVEHTFEKHTKDLEPGSPVRKELADLLQGVRDTPVTVQHLFPKYIRAPNGPEANPVKQLQPDEEEDYLDVEVQLNRKRIGEGNGTSSFVEWWVIKLADCEGEDCNILPMVIFNDKVSPPSLGFLAGYGIMGLYVSIVLVIGKFVRGFFSEISHSIMFEELPCVDRILKLCQDIYVVRERGELALEEELYAKLIFLYRSPETMIKWTIEKD
ncbi:piezo-type mechanosensitive ion channel component 1 isoform X1 [Pelobates fuscus]|uniref:piezo-type mechanosensitive ion channel component 1 isoform X1 n=1 Tax=Pelobates fuscus TaxID=191477 RepID=UPI002FE4C187